MKRALIIGIPAIVIIALGVWIMTMYSQSPGGGWSSSSSSSATSQGSTASSASPGTNTTGLPLSVPAGFRIEKFAEDIPGARVIVKDGFGNYWVSQPSKGTVTHIDLQSGSGVHQNAIFRNLRGPHGLVIDSENGGIDLYIAEEHRIIKARLYSDAPIETIADLPTGGRHSTRTLGIGPDRRLYVSIGSTCDVCEEANDEHASIISMKLDGTDRKTVATGLRNSVFFTWHPTSRKLFATDMGRDQLGDNLPPEEVNIIEDGKHYGWPYCYGNKVRDTKFGGETVFDCATTVAPHLTLPAHIAPLGLAFLPSSWPAEYRGDLLVAEHGSWNSTTPVGYKIVRLPLTSSGAPDGQATDFISGWMRSGTAAGRPVDIVVDGNTLLITDDKLGVVYRVRSS